jgi:hypothetical protein
MKNPTGEKHCANAQRGLFDTPDATPTIPPEALPEVHAALVELLLDAAVASTREVNSER